MRRAAYLILGAMAAAALAGVYVVAGALGPRAPMRLAGTDQRIAPGFIGIVAFGQWRLICVPGPPPLEGLAVESPLPGNGAGSAQATKAPTPNSCRINHEMPAPRANSQEVPSESAGEVLIAANFSRVGEKRTPAAMLRLPATAQTGDVITLRFDNETEVRTVVRDCAAECLATGTLSRDEWERLAAAKTLQVTFPLTGRQWVLLSLSIDGLAAAIAAMDRAETPVAR